MEIVVIDKKGRIVIPSRVRKKLNLKDEDRLLVLDVKDDILVLKKIDAEKILKDIAKDIAKAGLDLEELTREVEEEANRIAKEKISTRH
ncbi:MAG: AbrB/MazE/SpoVT family DNA-binding domain-containing protein [Caldisphaeraceae archaeon]|nr:AbrB/MazE/SpoVT family DNA-binding domain-containing protein [Caldisphaeraceae archaeon]MEB3797430.1 AbrB/MazE/SpoVT family DNA-binding domain-containing protein [Caldisphaeraceae archaeon]